jgi:hypothetical protein
MNPDTPKPAVVEIITWPPLWQYWPMYLALARTEEQFKNSGFRFKLTMCTESPVTDEAIRKDFFTRARLRHPVMALCGPRDNEIPPEANPTDLTNGGQEKSSVIRRLPIIGRQPHWILWRGAGVPIPKTSPEVWMYPEKTTSGDYVRTVIQTLPLFQIAAGGAEKVKVKERLLPPTLDDEAICVRDLGETGSYVVSFTPWHMLSDSQTTSLQSVLLPGPSLDVTALQIPDIEALPWLGGRPVVDHVGKHLKNVLSELSNTHGDKQLVAEFLPDNIKMVGQFLARDAAAPSWLDTEFLSVVLGEYVRLGCYFPYAALNSAISAEIQVRMAKILENLTGHALGAVQREMTEFFGESLDWESLSFAERRSLCGTPTEMTGNLTLALYMTHRPGDGMSLSLETRLKAIQVKIQDRPGRFALSGIVQRLPSICSFKRSGNHFALMEACVKSKEDAGLIKRSTARKQHQYPFCAACVVGGIPRSFLRPAAVRLAAKINVDVHYCSMTIDGVSHRRPYLISYTDIQPMVEHFILEKRPPSKEHSYPCQVISYNGVDSKSPDGGLILIGIWWHGSTEVYGGKEGDRTGTAFSNWKIKQEATGRRIAWTGYWRKGQDGPKEENPSNVGETLEDAVDLRNPKNANLIGAARGKFVEEQWDFGYVAIFPIDATDSRAAV